MFLLHQVTNTSNECAQIVTPQKKPYKVEIKTTDTSNSFEKWLNENMEIPYEYKHGIKAFDDMFKTPRDGN